MPSTDPPSLLTISAFGRLARLTPKALRLYAELGLLTPTRVGESGYRLYSPALLDRARTLALLRQLGVSLGEIARLLELSDGVRRAELQRYWQAQDQRHHERQALLEHLLSQPPLPGDAMSTQTYPIHERELPAQPVLSLKRPMRVDELHRTLPSTYTRLQAWAAAQGLDAEAQQGAEWFVIYHGPVNDREDGPVEVCFPLTATDVGAPLPEGCTLRTEPQRRELYTTLTMHQLEFPALLQAYDAVAAAVRERGLTPSAACRECYFGDASRPDEPFCRISFPVGR